MAAFSDLNGGSYLATIDWGDGSTPDSVTPVLVSGNDYIVEGSHSYSTADSFVITVTLGDGGGPGNVVVHSYLDYNDAPVTDDFDFAILETLADDDPVGTVVATDPDSWNTLTYAITAGDANGAFAIDNSGNITVDDENELDSATTPIYTLTP